LDIKAEYRRSIIPSVFFCFKIILLIKAEIGYTLQGNYCISDLTLQPEKECPILG